MTVVQLGRRIEIFSFSKPVEDFYILFWIYIITILENICLEYKTADRKKLALKIYMRKERGENHECFLQDENFDNIMRKVR